MLQRYPRSGSKQWFSNSSHYPKTSLPANRMSPPKGFRILVLCKEARDHRFLSRVLIFHSEKYKVLIDGRVLWANRKISLISIHLLSEEEDAET